MTQVTQSKLVLISYALPVYLTLILLASILNQQLAVRIIIGGAIIIIGSIIFATSIADLADKRSLRTVDIIIYALLVTLYAVLTGTVVVYYWKPWVVLYALIGIAGVLGAGSFASDLLSKLTN